MIHINGEFAPVRRLLAMTDPGHLTQWEKRIFAQLRFACSLSQKHAGSYDAAIGDAEDYLKKQYLDCGALTRAAVEEAERLLSPAAEEAKSYCYLCVAHAHIDMNWMWGYDETVGTTVDTFRTMLNIMNEYPEFKFSQSQASVYKIIEQHAPDMLEEIRERVKEGRWEITASTWVETDKNMPSGESLSRHILYTKDYLSGLFDIPADQLEIDFEPDTFGHSRNVPEILANGGVKYYYHCRGQVGKDILYRWRAPSGAEVLLYTEPFWYNADIDEHVGDYATELERLTGSKTLLKVYGVGDHGGGPTRRDVERILEMNRWPVYPSFRFSFLRDYFRAVASLRDSRPVLTDEINFLCDGCYTTQTRIKAGNRKSERLLREAEGFAALSRVRTGSAAPTAAFGEAWRKVLFNQFHDIIPGSGVTETREYASGLYQQVFAEAETAKKTAFRQICSRIDTASHLTLPASIRESRGEGGGSGFGLCGRGAGPERAFVLFNDEPVDRTEITELVLWDYEGNLDTLLVRDSQGREVPCQILQRGGGYWGHRYDRILIEAAVPAMGYALYVTAQQEEPSRTVSFSNDMRMQFAEEFVLENDLLKVRLNPLDGSLVSMVYKPTGREIIDSARSGGLFRLVQEAGVKAVTGWGTGMSAWFTGRYKEIASAQQRVEMKPVCSGPLRWAVQYETSFGSSKMTVTLSLDKGSSSLCCTVDCDWREFGQDDRIPALNFWLPLNGSCSRYRYDVPFGVTDREERDMDLPGCSFAAAPVGDETVMLMAKTKYGYRCVDNSMALTLIRGACAPDPTPEIGRHHIEFAVAVGESDWSSRQLLQYSSRYNHPFSVTSVSAHEGDLPAQDSLFVLEEGSVMVSALKAAEEGGNSLLLRVYETDGQSCQVTFRLGFEARSAVFTDLTERHTVGEARLTGDRLTFDMGPYQVRTLKVTF